MAKKKLEEAPKDEFVYARDTGKSMDAIKKEILDEEKAEKKEEPVVEVETPKEEKPPVVEEKVVEEKVDVKEVAREAAKEATEQLKKEIDEIKGQNLSKKDEKEAIEEAKTKWTKEGRNPKDYDEIVEEAENRAFNRMQKFIEERETKKAEEEAQRTKEEKEAAQKAEEQNKTAQERAQENLSNEIKELEEGGYIPKVTDENNPDDEGVVTRKALFQKGLEINNDRIAKGLPPESSIAKIFFMHFKGVNKQPAGADAPISGNKPSAVPKTSEKPYIYARDHNKTLSQIMQEEREKYTS